MGFLIVGVATSTPSTEAGRVGKCRYCGRSGWLLSVDFVGLCGFCQPAYTLEVPSRTRVIQDSERLVASSTKLDTRLSRCDVMIEQARGLLNYEQHGVRTIDPPPSELIRNTLSLKDHLIVEAMRGEVANARRKTGVAQSAKGKVTALTKALLTVREYKGRTSRPEVLNEIESELEAQLHRIQLDGYLDEARKAEFKGNKKKALDQYYEALYFLRHDSVADALQQEQIALIVAKIEELGGSPPA